MLSGGRRKPFHTTLVYFEFNEDLDFIEEGQAARSCHARRAHVGRAGSHGAAPLRVRCAALEEDHGRRPGDEEPFLFEDVPGASDGDWPEYLPFYLQRALPRHVLEQFGT